MKNLAHRIHQIAALCILVVTYSPVPSAQGQTCAPIPAGVVSWWQAESNALDSADGNDGSLVGNVTYAPGKVGQAFSFDGGNNYVSIPSSSRINFRGNMPMTIETWVYRTGGATTMHILGKRNGCYLGEIQYQLAFDPTGGLSFIGDGGNFWVNTYRQLPMNTWQHLAATYDGTNVVIFIDGQPVASGSGSLGPALAAPLEIGSAGSCATDYSAAFAGLIDEVSIYNRALSTNEVQAIYAAGSAGKCVVSNPPPPYLLAGPITNSANGHLYYLLAATNWPAAEQIAVSLGGHLATINNAPENTWIFDTFSAFGGLERLLWIGLNDSAQEGTWVWVSGEPVTYLNWSAREPNSGGGVFPDEDHALIWHPSSGHPLGSWNDAPSNQVQYAVVEVAPPPPPVIASQPTNVTVYVGSNATFRVTATGDAPLSYQWQFNGTNLTGKTSSILSFTSVQFSNAGLYSVSVSNAGGSINSSNAVLTVNPQPDCAPLPAGLVSWWRAESNTLDSVGLNDVGHSFTQPLSPNWFTAGKVGAAFRIALRSYFIAPARAELNVGTGEGLTVEGWVRPDSITGAQSLIEWNDSEGNVGAGLMLNAGFLEGYLTDTNTQSIRRVVLRSPPGAITNAAWQHVALVVDKASELASIFINGITVAQTNLGTFSPLTQSPVYFGFRPSGIFAGNYFSGGLDEMAVYNRAVSQNEILAIFNADFAGKCLVAPGVVVTQPQDQAIPLGEDVKFTVSVLGSRPLRYQWRFNGINLAGATNSALVLEKLQTNRVGNYSVFVSNARGTATSSNAALTLLPPPTCTDSPAGLISWWPGDGNLADAMGTNNAKLFSPALYVTGKVDRAFSFDGVSSRIDLSSSPSLNFGSNADFSIEMWIKAGASNTVFANVPIFERLGANETRIGYSLSLNQGRLAFAMGSSPLSATNVSVFTSQGPDLRDAMFHHVAVSVIRTATNGGNLYVDGQLVLNFDPTPRKGSLVTGASLYIGAPASTTSNSYFGGLIDEPAIYNRALTASEILAIRQAGAAGKCKVKPSILVQPLPASQKVTLGSNVTYSVTASGTSLLRYQWFRSNFTISGATSSSYSFLAGGGTNSYSVRVTNVFGSITSSNAVLIGNYVPTALPQDVVLNEDTPTLIKLMGHDLNLDPLSYVIFTRPARGALSGSGTNVVYTPSPNYNGPDGFMFKFNDGLVDSTPAFVGLTVRPVNDAPVAAAQSVSLNEDTSVAIDLTASDVDGDKLFWSIVNPPAHGILSGKTGNYTYLAVTNYFGPDGFTFNVNDGQVDSTVAAVSINVISSPDVPVAKATISPLAQFPGNTNLMVISPNNSNAIVVLDGSLSTDVENDPLQYSWLEGTNVIASGVLATNLLDVGTHIISLAVSDGTGLATDTVMLEVMTPSQSVEILVAMVKEAGLSKKHGKELLASLKEVAHAFQKNKLSRGIKRLTSFQDKVRKRIAPVDQALADELINGAQLIINAQTGP